MSETNFSTITNDDPVYGHRVHHIWEPELARATIVLVHGLAEHGARYQPSGAMLAGAGYRVVAPDLHGFGLSGGRRGDVLAWTDYLEQVETLVADARSTDLPVVVMGHSMGGLLCGEYLLSERPAPDLSVLSAPALGGGAAWQKVMASLLKKVVPTLMIPNNLDGSQLSRDPDVGEAYFADPLVFTKTSVRLGASLFGAQARVSAGLQGWTVPTLVMHGGADTIVPPISSLPMADLGSVERRLYPKLRHEILNEPEGPELVAEIIAWIEKELDS